MTIEVVAGRDEYWVEWYLGRVNSFANEVLASLTKRVTLNRRGGVSSHAGGNSIARARARAPQGYSLDTLLIFSFARRNTFELERFNRLLDCSERFLLLLSDIHVDDQGRYDRLGGKCSPCLKSLECRLHLVGDDLFFFFLAGFIFSKVFNEEGSIFLVNRFFDSD